MRGIDVSHWQGDIDWQRVANDDVAYVLIKLTEGVGYVDPRAHEYARGAREAGLEVGFYHFATPKADDALEEAAAFLEALDDAPDYTVIPALDLEKNDDNLSRSEITQWALDWLEAVKVSIGVKPMWYSSPNWLTNKLDPNMGLQSYPLWVAHYGPGGDAPWGPGITEPRVPDEWQPWSLWQYTSNGSVDGVSSSRVDLDEAVDLDDLLVEPAGPSYVLSVFGDLLVLQAKTWAADGVVELTVLRPGSALVETIRVPVESYAPRRATFTEVDNG